MNSPRATVSKLLTFSCVDGPGNRLVLFLQGCNFACLTCHNPHTMGRCNNCGDCIPACHAGALSLRDGRIAFDPASCDGCDACLDICPVNASPMTRTMSVGEVLDVVRQNLLFLDGLTLSGGEATTQLKFVTALFQAVKADEGLRRLTTLIDSNGHLGPRGWDEVLPWTDGVMLDIKALDSEQHRLLTGVGNARVLESARKLKAADKLEELRFLVVPGITDTEAEISALQGFIKEIGPVRLRLNAFRQHGVRGEAQGWPPASRETVEAMADRLSAAGMADVTVPSVWV